ncbi:MAG: HAD family hydrolase [Chloroflexota bacterium]
MPRISAVLFDLYDTLAYLDGQVIRDARRELAVLADVNHEAFMEQWRDTAWERMLGALGTLDEQIALMLGRLGAQDSPELVTRMVEVENQAWREAVHLYPESLPLLRELRERGYRLGLLSNCSCQAGAVVTVLGLDALMDTLALSCEVRLAKPDPAFFRHACQALGVTVEQTMFVADGAFGELDAATDLGMIAVKVEQPHQSGDYGTSERYDHCITDLGQVLALLQ